VGDGIATLGAFFGFLAVATSFLATALNLQSTFLYDLKFRRVSAWLMTGGVPIAFFLVGTQDFISIVGFTGAVFGGVTAVMIALLYIAVTKKKLVTERPLGLPLWLAYVSIGVLSLGALYEVADSLSAMLK
jgi:amino acid permease